MWPVFYYLPWQYWLSHCLNSDVSYWTYQRGSSFESFADTFFDDTWDSLRNTKHHCDRSVRSNIWGPKYTDTKTTMLVVQVYMAYQFSVEKSVASQTCLYIWMWYVRRHWGSIYPLLPVLYSSVRSWVWLPLSINNFEFFLISAIVIVLISLAREFKSCSGNLQYKCRGCVIFALGEPT